MLQFLQQMTQKYYHNNYKQLLGIDQTRTASEKLLDKAIGGIKPEPKQEKDIEKKFKQEHSNLTHQEVLDKIIKNVDGNSNASKLVKPVNILKKCLEDISFVLNQQLNSYEKWSSLLHKLIDMNERVVGNYSQISVLNDSLIEVYMLLENILKKAPKKESQELTLKKQEGVQVQQEQKCDVSVRTCEFQIMYCKLFTDDSFAFNKTLAAFKLEFLSCFQKKLDEKDISLSLFNYLQNLLLSMFKLPYKKYEWVKSSLTQFFKEFNITYKHLLNPDLLQNYLASYNSFINLKEGKGNGDDVNVFGSSKGGKIKQVEVVKGDGYDSWASRQ